MATIAVNGVRLNVQRAGEGLPLVLLHGFTGSIATWRSHLDMLAGQFSIVAVDLPGHGASDAPDSARCRMEQCVADLLDLLDRLEISRAALFGYSMGGRVALNLALAVPERVRALILESASPGIADPDERLARCRNDDALAAMIEREGIEAFVDYWERLPLFASQERLPSSVRSKLRAQRLSSNPAGLANSLRGAGAGMQEPLWGRLSDIRQPTLLITGELDRKPCELGRLMEERMPAAHLVVVPNAGHAVHLEQPTVFEECVVGRVTKETQLCL